MASLLHEAVRSSDRIARRLVVAHALTDSFASLLLAWLAASRPAPALLGPIMTALVVVSVIAYLRAYFSVPRPYRRWSDWSCYVWENGEIRRLSLRGAGLPESLVHSRWLPVGALALGLALR